MMDSAGVTVWLVVFDGWGTNCSGLRLLTSPREDPGASMSAQGCKLQEQSGEGQREQRNWKRLLLARTSDLYFTGNSETNDDATSLLQPSKKQSSVSLYFSEFGYKWGVPSFLRDKFSLCLV